MNKATAGSGSAPRRTVRRPLSQNCILPSYCLVNTTEFQILPSRPHAPWSKSLIFV